MGLICWLCRYWSDPKVLTKLSAAMGDSFDPTAMAAAQGEAEGPAEDEEELDVHGAASAGKLPVTDTTAPKLSHVVMVQSTCV